MAAKTDKRWTLVMIVAAAFAYGAIALVGLVIVAGVVHELRDSRTDSWRERLRSVSASPATSSDPRRPAPAVATATMPAFSRSLSSERFVFATDVDIELEPLMRIAESTRERTRAWLGIGPGANAGAKPVDVFLCRDVDTLYALEAARGWWSSNVPNRTFPFEGGCYSEVNMIAVLASDHEQPLGLIAHEVGHLVFHDLVGRHSNALDEGLACFISDWMMRGASTSAAEFARREADIADWSRAAELRSQPLPSLRELVGFDYWQFRDAKTKGGNFTLAENLTRTLIGSEDPRIRGRYLEFLRSFRRGGSEWAALRSQYDTRVVEAMWRERSRRAARFGSLFGEWSANEHRVRGWAVGDTSSALLCIDPPRERAGWRLAFTPEFDPPPMCSMGFTAGCRGPDEFLYVELQRDTGVCSILERAGDGWSTHATYALPPKFSFACRRIELTCDATGTLTLRVDERPLFSHALGSAVLHGRNGFMVSQRDRKTPKGVLTEAVFGDVFVGE